MVYRKDCSTALLCESVLAYNQIYQVCFKMRFAGIVSEKMKPSVLFVVTANL